jgi:hypothetical protein
MAEYALTQMGGWVSRTEDGMPMPDTEPEYVAWIEAGGVPDPYVPPPVNTTAPPTSAARLDDGVNSAMATWNENTPQAAPGGGQGGLSVEERLKRLEASLIAMVEGHGLSTSAPTPTMKR